MKCYNQDCFHCPYPDCILDYDDISSRMQTPKSRKNQKSLREQRKELGLCTKCGQPAVEGKTLCQNCLEAQREYIRDYRAKQKTEPEQDYTSKLKKQIKKQQKLIEMLMSERNAEFANGTEKCETVKLTFNRYEFYKYLIEKGLAKTTAQNYIDRVSQYFKEYSILNENDLSKFEQRIRRTRKPGTINLTVAAFENYFKFANFNLYKFERIKQQRKTFCDTAVNYEQYIKFVDFLSKNEYTEIWKAVLVIGNTGVRISELIELKTADLEKGYADIRGKGNKIRRIYYTDSLINAIEPYCNSDYIISKPNGGKYTRFPIENYIHKLGIQAGLPSEVAHPHSFRHFFAKQFLKNNNDITLLGDLLGHSDISTTAIYTRLTSDEQKEQVNKIVNW